MASPVSWWKQKNGPVWQLSLLFLNFWSLFYFCPSHVLAFSAVCAIKLMLHSKHSIYCLARNSDNLLYFTFLRFSCLEFRNHSLVNKVFHELLPLSIHYDVKNFTKKFAVNVNHHLIGPKNTCLSCLCTIDFAFSFSKLF